ncbi:uncharacterized protein LOC115779984 [Archocentrus centrarchus]|uniref:uncharacterized protein LOC115779984 n=1 Tax=Archocentrus centrarchus TaxID=63155 RepID=UPI0011E9F418|nr:uncharacterized protein LOC115779984 [Archocentrus centrarchus]
MIKNKQSQKPNNTSQLSRVHHKAAACLKDTSMAMKEQVAFYLFCVSLAVLVLALIILLFLCWILKQNRNRNFTELQISAGQPSCKLTIRTKPDHADQLLDHLLDRVFLQVDAGLVSGEDFLEEAGPQTGGEFMEEVRLEPEQELREECGPYPAASASTSPPRRAVTALHNGLRQWFLKSAPHQTAPRQTSPVDQTDNVCAQQSNEFQLASLSSACSASSEEDEQHDEAEDQKHKDLPSSER